MMVVVNLGLMGESCDVSLETVGVSRVGDAMVWL